MGQGFSLFLRFVTCLYLNGTALTWHVHKVIGFICPCDNTIQSLCFHAFYLCFLFPSVHKCLACTAIFSPLFSSFFLRYHVHKSTNFLREKVHCSRFSCQLFGCHFVPIPLKFTALLFSIYSADFRITELCRHYHSLSTQRNNTKHCKHDICVVQV